MTKVTVWNENRHEQTHEKVKEVYPRWYSQCNCLFFEGSRFGYANSRH